MERRGHHQVGRVRHHDAHRSSDQQGQLHPARRRGQAGVAERGRDRGCRVSLAARLTRSGSPVRSGGGGTVGAMNKRVVVSAALAIALTVSSCGGNSTGPTTAVLSDQLATVCRSINRGIGNLDAPTSLDDVRSNATDASALYEDGLTQLKKLPVPTSDKQFASDVKDLISSFEDQLDTLDAIAKAAKENDQGSVDTRMNKLTDQASESNDLAASLEISRCHIDPVFTDTVDTTPATTEPAVPLTLPIL